MTTQTIILTALGLYAFLLLIVGFLSTRGQTHEGFVIGNRNVGLIPTIGSLAASLRDGGGIIIWIGIGFTIGYSGFWIVAGVLLGLLVLSYFGPRVREIAIRKNYITVGQMLTDVIGKYTSRSVSGIILFLAALIISIQLYVSGNLVANILGYPSWIGICAVALVIALYLFAGGYSSVVKTDFIQFFVMFSFIAIPFFIEPAKADIMNIQQLFVLGENDLAYFGVGLFLMLSGADIWQRIFSARSKNVIRWGFPLVAPV
ncbi:MAG: sodium:solute symporter family transporter, partial [Alphaproteobacteria bacterium]